MVVDRMEEIFNKHKRDYLFNFSRLLNKAMVEPDMLQLMVTSRCQLQCKMCNVWKQRFQEEAGAEDIKRFIDEALSMGIKTIYFTGGEALLRKDIFELIDYAARPGIVTTINTNGGFINEETAEKIVRSRLRNISFSIDGASPKTHNFFRGEGIFEKAMRSIEYLNYYKKKYGRGRNSEDRVLDIAMVSVIMKKNMEELPALADLARKIGCCYIAFQPLVNNGDLPAPLENNELWIEEKDIPRLQQIFDILIAKKRQFSGFMHIDIMPEKTIKHFRGEGFENTCFAGFNRIFVNPQGDMSFVCLQSFGNIKKDSLKQLWYAEDTGKIREMIKNCKKSCTQFCSERSQSDDISLIHEQLEIEIRNLPRDAQITIRKEEYFFLQSMRGVLNSKTEEPDSDIVNTLKKLENILNSFRGSLTISQLYGFGIFQNWVGNFSFEEISVSGQPKPGVPFESKINEIRKRINLKGLTILDMGCLEGMHSSLLQGNGAKKVISIEGRKENFLKALIVKNAFKLDKCEFLFGDANEVLSSFSGHFDLCLASGVLYHLNNPVALLYRIGQLCNSLFVWSHYANDSYPIAPAEGTRWNNRIYRGKYFDENINDIVCGLEKRVFWLFEEDLLAAIRDAGFNSIEIIGKEKHEHGPAITLWATK
ncbi:MAG: radical SAM protein [Candidatus Omnitrophota bacterium]